MDQWKVGRFIRQCRIEKGLTQAQLAETCGITDKAVSKWENGRSCPYASIMVKLCELLGISVNELLNGERSCSEDAPEPSTESASTDELDATVRRKWMADCCKTQKIMLLLNYIITSIRSSYVYRP